MQACRRLATIAAMTQSSVRRLRGVALRWRYQFAPARDRCGLARDFADPPRPRWICRRVKFAGRKPKRSSLDLLVRCVLTARRPVKPRLLPQGEKTRFGIRMRSSPIVSLDD